jgi:hypothetical protein
VPAESNRSGHDIVVIGASAGGVEALGELVPLLPEISQQRSSSCCTFRRPALTSFSTRRSSCSCGSPTTAQALRSSTGQFVVAVDNQHVLRVIELADARDLVHIERTVIEAVEYVVDQWLTV